MGIQFVLYKFEIHQPQQVHPDEEIHPGHPETQAVLPEIHPARRQKTKRKKRRKSGCFLPTTSSQRSSKMTNFILNSYYSPISFKRKTK